MDAGNLFDGISRRAGAEVFDALVATPGLRIERIVSTGQATPSGQWLDQEAEEWVVLLTGGAGLRFEGEADPRVMRPGDWLHILAHARHRVEWTDGREPTLWLAVHYSP